MKSIQKRSIITVFVCVAVAAVFLITAALEYNRSLESEKRKASDQLLLAKGRIESILTAQIIGARGLIAYVQTNPHFTQKAFENYAQGLYESQNQIVRNLSILKDTTITNVYPVKGNEAAIGRDLSAIEGQKETVLAVKRSGKMQLTAPVKLIQGGTGIIVRIPISLTDPETGTTDYWGQMSLVFDYDKLLLHSGLTALSESNFIELHEQDAAFDDKQVIWSNIAVFPPDGISETINLYQANWELLLIPKNGWNGTPPTFWLILLLGFFAVAGAAYGINKLLAAKDLLESRIQERTEALKTTNEYLEENMAELEESHAELTIMNDRLQQSLEDLREAQEQLIISEKLAALGELVAGVAHEINTPLGISVTLSSFISRLHHTLRMQFENNLLNRSDLHEFLINSDEAMDLMNSNLERASSLVASFKQVAVDQASQEKRTFKVRESVQDVIKSLHPKLKNTPYTLELECDDQLEITSYPGAISQIITNFVINSLIHGFADRSDGHIHMAFKRNGSTIIFLYDDDGVGIPEENIAKVFNPFFSTRKQSGSTGLGLHIIHNIVTQTLCGQISLTSGNLKGVHFKIVFEDQY